MVDDSPVVENNTMRWYVIHTYSGHENKVKQYLDNMIAQRELQDKIGQVLVPIENVVEMKQGKKTSTTRKLFPSYVVIEMEMDKVIQHLVMETPGVTHFVGVNAKPQPLTEKDVKRILNREEQTRHQESIKVPYVVGDQVKVVDGPFTDFSGVVEKVNPERGKIKVTVSIFGRGTPVELDFLQVAPASA